jgi:hypothetical protein
MPPLATRLATPSLDLDQRLDDIGGEAIGGGIDRERRQGELRLVALAGQRGGDERLTLLDALGMDLRDVTDVRHPCLHRVDLAFHMGDATVRRLADDLRRLCRAIAREADGQRADCGGGDLTAAGDADPAQRPAVVEQDIAGGEESANARTKSDSRTGESYHRTPTQCAVPALTGSGLFRSS